MDQPNYKVLYTNFVKDFKLLNENVKKFIIFTVFGVTAVQSGHGVVTCIHVIGN